MAVTAEVKAVQVCTVTSRYGHLFAHTHKLAPRQLSRQSVAQQQRQQTPFSAVLPLREDVG